MKETVKSFIIGFLIVLLVAVSGLCVLLFMTNRSQKRQITARQERLDYSEEKLKETLEEISRLEEELDSLKNGSNQNLSATTTKSENGESESQKNQTGNAKKKKEAQTNKEKQQIADLSDLEHAKTQSLVKPQDIDVEHLENYFRSYEISDELFNRIYGDDKSYKTYCTIPREDLRYIKVLHFDYNGDIRVGEMIANAVITEDLLYIFRTLYENKYQIEKMILVEKYGADDDTSVNDNNTSCFNFRHATDSATLSNHATGCAVDINPLQNPYFRIHEDGTFDYDNVDADLYWDRTNDPENRHMITHSDLCYQLFAERGFSWGGDWPNPVDYQHFEKPVY